MHYREQLGFVAGEGVLSSVQTLDVAFERKELTVCPKASDALVIVELFCEPESAIRKMCQVWKVEYLGIAEKVEETATLNQLGKHLDMLRELGFLFVHLHVNFPCAAEIMIASEEFDPVLSEAVATWIPEYQKLSTSMSMVGPSSDSFWKTDGVVKTLERCNVACEAEVALCQVGYVSPKSRLLVGKRWKFCSNQDSFAHALSGLNECKCSTHAAYDDASWSKEGLYSQKLAARILKGIVDIYYKA